MIPQLITTSPSQGAEQVHDENVDRRSFLKVMGVVGMSSTLLPEAAFACIRERGDR